MNGGGPGKIGNALQLGHRRVAHRPGRHPLRGEHVGGGNNQCPAVVGVHGDGGIVEVHELAQHVGQLGSAGRGDADPAAHDDPVANVTPFQHRWSDLWYAAMPAVPSGY